MLQRIYHYAAEALLCCRGHIDLLQRPNKFAAEAISICCRGHMDLLQRPYHYAAEAISVSLCCRGFAMLQRFCAAAEAIFLFCIEYIMIPYCMIASPAIYLIIYLNYINLIALRWLNLKIKQMQSFLLIL